MISAIKGTVHSLLRNHAKLFVFTTILFVVGIVFGTIVVGALSPEQKLSLFTTTQNFFTAINENRLADASSMAIQAVGKNMKLLGLIWILGLSIIGLPLIVVLLFMQGFFIGFTVGFLVDQFASKGLLFSLLAVLPQNLIVTPALIIASVAGIVFSLMLVKSRFAGQVGAMSLRSQFIRYTLFLAFLGFVLVLGGLVEGYITPGLMRIVAPHLS